MTVAVGGSGSAQHAFNTATSTTGTLSAPAASAWTALTAYVVDATITGTNRVTNAGNLYACITAGTSAISGGPTTTSTNITDGTAHWYYIGPAPSADTAAGSQILVLLARGTQSTAATLAPSDNDSGGTYLVVNNTQYAGFPDNFAGVWRRPTAANTKTGFAATATWGPFTPTPTFGDGITLGWVELQGVAVGAPHAVSETEVSTATAGTVTSASITTTQTCLVVSFWFGNGDGMTAGTIDTGTPGGGLTLVGGATCPVAISNNGYMHCAVAARVAAPGTFTESWTTTGQGAMLITVAFAILAPEHDDAPAVGIRCWPVPNAGPAALRVLGTDEIPGTAAPAIVEDEPALITLPRWPWLAMAPAADNDQVPGTVATTTPDEDASRLGVPWLPIVWAVSPQLGDEQMPGAVLEDDAPALPRAQSAAWATARPVDSDDYPASAVLDDEAALALTVSRATWLASPAGAVDDFAPALLDEDQWIAPVLAAQPWVIQVTRDADDLPFTAAATVDDEVRAQAWTWPAVATWQVAAAPDELSTLAAAVDDDIGPPSLIWQTPAPLQIWAAPDEVAPFLTVDDETSLRAQIWPVAAAPQLGTVSDDVPLVAAAPDDDSAQAAALAAPAPWAIVVVNASDELPQTAAAVEDDGWTFRVTWTSPTPVPVFALGDEVLPTQVVGATVIDDDAVGRPAPWAMSTWTRVPLVADELSTRTPTEVYDGSVADDTVYFGSVQDSEVYDGPLPPQELL